MAEHAPALTGPVEVVGAGLLGTSVALALAAQGTEVWLSDLNHEHVRTATGLGAGTPTPPDGTPALVVVAVPPDHIADVVVSALEAGAPAVTDVGSVKAGPLEVVADRVEPALLGRYVGGHPMAGNEHSGPLAASAALFEGRPWAVTPHTHAEPRVVATVEQLARACGAEVVRLSPVEHDRAVARTSHVPHLLAVLAAGQLTDAQPEHMLLSGQGVRDVTRVAAGDPGLYAQILRGNSAVVGEFLSDVRRDLDRLIAALDAEGEDPEEELDLILSRGVDGTLVIPPKHGRVTVATGPLVVLVPDTAGELARLFADVGEIGVNVEDVRIEHDPLRPVGHVELTVASDEIERLQSALGERGWTSHR